MRLLNETKLKELQSSPSSIRNICIMAHVDHGKTTLADSLVASNGIISQRMAGKLRYMDSRKDEQERGITMKSSSIALYYNFQDREYLINLIDSPGHVDFSSEVSTAVRLCDGAIIVVDVVEGVCPQTQIALKQAWLEKIKPVLVLNKIDRLILEMKFTPLDAYIHISQVLEQVNAITGKLFASDVIESQDQIVTERSNPDVYSWSDGLNEADDSNLYFNPMEGNVIFASAIDGWGFNVDFFAKLYSSKLGLDESTLLQTIWGDYYFNSKTKKVLSGAQGKAKKPLFVQLILENIWSLYDTICIRKDKDKLGKIIDSLGLKISTRDMRHTDPKIQLQAVCSQWLPLAPAVLNMVCSVLPAANSLSEEKVEQLMCSGNKTFSSYLPETQALKQSFLNCDSNESASTIVFISKMFPVERKLLPENRARALTAEEIALRRELARQRHAERLSAPVEEQISLLSLDSLDDNKAAEPEEPLTEDVFVAFARVYSGTISVGQSLYVLGPKHNPSLAVKQMNDGEMVVNDNLTLKDLKSNQHITKVTIKHLYLMMGRELENLQQVPAGNVLGIGGLDEHVLKSATLSSELYCPSFSELNLLAVPILRVAVEPVRPLDLPALRQGLRLLNQADACVQVIIQETGEHVLVTAGEVHLERCIDDLRTRYAKVEINVSAPIVPFRETVVTPPKLDMVNETIQDSSAPKLKINSENSLNDSVISITTPNKQSSIQLECLPLPRSITDLLDNNSELLKLLELFNSGSNDEEKEEVDFKTVKAFDNFKSELEKCFETESGRWNKDLVNKIWCFGPKYCGQNILINMVKNYESRSVWSKEGRSSHPLSEFDSSFVNGFQMATAAGPLCEEPMMGVAFLVLSWVVDDCSGSSVAPSVYGPLSGQIMSAVREGCRRSFSLQPQRLMAAMYCCHIQANAEILGKLYALLNRRQGRILHGDMSQGSASSFNITAVLPVIESFNFAQEIRKQTSGLAIPQLVFSHWEVIEMDPFWIPTTEEEYLHYGEKADYENKARVYMDSVRRRKGLKVQAKVVEFAEKQRTLHKKK